MSSSWRSASFAVESSWAVRTAMSNAAHNASSADAATTRSGAPAPSASSSNRRCMSEMVGGAASSRDDGSAVLLALRASSPELHPVISSTTAAATQDRLGERRQVRMGAGYRRQSVSQQGTGNDTAEETSDTSVGAAAAVDTHRT
ncbi:MAG: hypothetical protein M5U19_07420 [Microthrixaceae bacterium]|nr:hypothetical protein [Microthrixaceae bacterium]